MIRVKAAGVNQLDWIVAEGKARSWFDHCLPLGWELGGTVERLGAEMGRFKVGNAIFGMINLSGDGADAEFAVGDEKMFALKPKTLDFSAAAAVPIGALTAYQAAVRHRRIASRTDGVHSRDDRPVSGKQEAVSAGCHGSLLSIRKMVCRGTSGTAHASQFLHGSPAAFRRWGRPPKPGPHAEECRWDQ